MTLSDSSWVGKNTGNFEHTGSSMANATLSCTSFWIGEDLMGDGFWWTTIVFLEQHIDGHFGVIDLQYSCYHLSGC